MKSITRVLFAATVILAVVNFSAKAYSTIEDRHLTGFNAIRLSASYDVYITQGTTESVKVDGTDDEREHLVTEVKNGVLNIYNKQHSGWNLDWGSKKTIVYVSVKDINSISVSGSGDVYFKGGISTNAMKIQVTGSGDVTGKFNVKTLEVGISGSGDVRLTGRADDCSARVSGSGDYSARDLVTVNTAIRVSGSGDATINVNNKVDAAVSGSGDIGYTGAAKQVATSKSGSGDIHRI